jgi:hypothetical protein
MGICQPWSCARFYPIFHAQRAQRALGWLTADEHVIADAREFVLEETASLKRNWSGHRAVGAGLSGAARRKRRPSQPTWW